jgi:hypothetical protein
VGKRWSVRDGGGDLTNVQVPMYNEYMYILITIYKYILIDFFKLLDCIVSGIMTGEKIYMDTIFKNIFNFQLIKSPNQRYGGPIAQADFLPWKDLLQTSPPFLFPFSLNCQNQNDIHSRMFST